MPDGPQKLKAMNRFRLRLAALYAHPDGRLCTLARLIGISRSALKSQVRSQDCLASAETKEGIERLLGRQFLPPDRPKNGQDWSYLSR